MEAYASFDGPMRRKMEEMLQTWKAPVPGSVDKRPVFPLDTTRPIENALIKARTNAMRADQEHSRAQQALPGVPGGRPRPGSAAAFPGQAAGQPYRHTPTPPAARPVYSAPPASVPQRTASGGEFGNGHPYPPPAVSQESRAFFSLSLSLTTGPSDPTIWCGSTTTVPPSATSLS